MPNQDQGHLILTFWIMFLELLPGLNYRILVLMLHWASVGLTKIGLVQDRSWSRTRWFWTTLDPSNRAHLLAGRVLTFDQTFGSLGWVWFLVSHELLECSICKYNSSQTSLDHTLGKSWLPWDWYHALLQVSRTTAHVFLVSWTATNLLLICMLDSTIRNSTIAG